MASFADGEIKAFVGPEELGAANNLEEVIVDFVSEEPYLVARIEAVPDVHEPSPELEALTRNVQNTFSEII